MNIGKLLQTLDVSDSYSLKYSAEALSMKNDKTLMDVKLYFNEINSRVETTKFENISFDAGLMIKIK